MQEIIIYTDGGSRGNPGPAAAGFVITDKNAKRLCARGAFLGKATNNEAEYIAIIKALEAARQFKAEQITVFSDSELLVRQINGQYKIKSEKLRPLYRRAAELLDEFKNYKIRHIPREKNTEADELVNRALDIKQNITDDAAVPQTSNERRVTSDESRTRPLRLGVLISGGGTTLINILEYIKQGRLNAQVAVVISSRSTVAGVERANNAGLNVKVIRKKDFSDIDEFSTHIEKELSGARVELVVQAGWLCLWKIHQKYTDRVMNIHPALLPSFGGQGMWGHHVHQAVLDAGCKLSGCTVHFCTNEYDKGPIIVQLSCPVEETDTPDTLAARVFEQESIAYPKAIKLFAEKRLSVRDGKVKIKP